MEAEIARLKQDLKVDREIRKVLKKINSKEGSIAETIHQRTEWLQSAGYQIDETEYTEMFVSELHRSLLWRLVLLGVIFGLVGTMFAREGISLITAAGGGVGTFAMSMSMRSVYRFLAFLGKVYEEEVSLKVRQWVFPVIFITSIVVGLIPGIIFSDVSYKIDEYRETGSITEKNWVYHFNEDKTVTLTKYLGKGGEVNVPENT